jgi:hypothetical protein
MKFKLCFGGKNDPGWTQTYNIYQTKLYLWRIYQLKFTDLQESFWKN